MCIFINTLKIMPQSIIYHLFLTYISFKIFNFESKLILEENSSFYLSSLKVKIEIEFKDT